MVKNRLKMAIFGQFCQFSTFLNSENDRQSMIGLLTPVDRLERCRYYAEVMALGHNEAVGSITTYCAGFFNMFSGQLLKLD